MNGDRDSALYTFDCRGYLVHRGFLDPGEVANARECLSHVHLARDAWHEDQQRASDIHRSPGFLMQLGDTLYHHPATRLAISYPHRLLESYALIRRSGVLDLHGGAAEFVLGSDTRDISARSWVHAGRSYALRVKVLIYLDDVVRPEDGRLAYVEGSHKAEYAFHSAFPGGRREAGDLLRTIETRAGDAVWLNEALLHGAERKTSSTPRRLFAYTFGPTFMASWSEIERESIAACGYAPTETEKADGTNVDE